MDSIKVKSTKVLAALMIVPFHPKMIDLASWVGVRLSEVIFTSGFRAVSIHANDSGIASTIPCRHLDMRSWIYKEPQKVVDDINKYWRYDPKRPKLMCAIFHDTGLGVHIHLQVHDKTIHLGG